MDDDVARDGSKRVLIADPQPIFRLGLVALLESAYPTWDILESDTLEAYRSHLEQGAIDLLILESRQFGMQLAQRLPVWGSADLSINIIAVTEQGDSVGALGCLAAGAHATVSRSDPTSRTLATIELLSTRHQQDASPRSSHGITITPPTEAPGSSEILTLTAASSMCSDCWRRDNPTR